MAKINKQIDSLWKSVEDIETKYGIKTMSLSQRKEIEELRDKYEGSFYEFVKAAWPVLEGRENPYVDNWHVKALCDHMEALYRFQISHLIVNLPPRTSKSAILCLYPCWVWAKDPSQTFMYVSHSQATLATRDSRRCKDVITSAWYRRLWGHKVSIRKDANTIREWHLTGGGCRFFTSPSSSVTGLGFSHIIFEDVDDKGSIFSPVARERTHMELDGGFFSRVSKPGGCRFVLSQQRLHMQDTSGYMLSKDNSHIWTVFSLPMEYVKRRACKTIPLPGTNGKPWQDPRRKEGELLWPNFWTKEQVDKQKATLGSTYLISSQLQQWPSADEGNIIARDSWRIWDKSYMPAFNYIIQSWDTAYGGANSAYSAVTVWGVFIHPDTDTPNILLINAWRGRPIYPKLKEIIKRMSKNYFDTDVDYEPLEDSAESDCLLIEAKATGSPIIQELGLAGILAVPYDPSKTDKYTKPVGQKYNSKDMRAAMASDLIYAGRVWLPTHEPKSTRLAKHADEFLEACCAFPADDSRDYVDSMSQALLYLKKCRHVWIPGEPAADEYDHEHLINSAIARERGPIY